jgi:hypothetical protein
VLVLILVMIPCIRNSALFLFDMLSLCRTRVVLVYQLNLIQLSVHHTDIFWSKRSCFSLSYTALATASLAGLSSLLQSPLQTPCPTPAPSRSQTLSKSSAQLSVLHVEIVLACGCSKPHFVASTYDTTGATLLLPLNC